MNVLIVAKIAIKIEKRLIEKLNAKKITLGNVKIKFLCIKISCHLIFKKKTIMKYDETIEE